MNAEACRIDARWRELQERNDLDWDLDAIVDRNQAIAFLRRFENKLCVYSAYVEKLYSNYSFVVPEAEHGAITILPNEQAWHDIFHNIPEEAIEPTGVHVMPGEAVCVPGLILKVPAEHRLAPSRELGFQQGLRLLIQRYQERGDYFLPVLVKGDLREYESRLPSLHLHRINIARLGHLSALDVQSIRGVIADHLIGLFRVV